MTGANSGIGLEAARELVGRGAHVVFAVRDMARGETAAATLAGPGSTSVVELDLADVDRVAGGAATLLGSPVSAVAVHPGAAATDLFARQLERGGRRLLARASRIGTGILLPSAAAGARATLRALDDRTPSGAFIGPAGFSQLRGQPELLGVYPSAQDPATAARLWELTEQALGRPLPV